MTIHPEKCFSVVFDGRSVRDGFLSVALNQGRYTWHHDSVLPKIVEHIKTYLDSDENLHADLPNHRASDNPPNTIPPEILLTSARPGIVTVKSNCRPNGTDHSTQLP